MEDGFNNMADIIILAAFAIFLVLRLRSTLGKKTGFDGYESYKPSAKQLNDKNIIAPISKKEELEKDKEKPQPDKMLDELDAKLVDEVKKVKEIDASFTMDNFIKGAKIAFDMVFDAFNKGDENTLKMLLNDKLYKNMHKEIDADKNADEHVDTMIVGIDSAEVKDIKLSKHVAKITVDFVSEQFETVKDSKGNEIAGKTTEVEKVFDVWVFERNLKLSDPTWKIIAM